MMPYLQHLKTHFEQWADPIQAGPMKAYMRHQFEFLGLKRPTQQALFKQFVAEQGLPDLADLETVVRSLWTWPEREYQYIALTFLDRHQKYLGPHSPILA